MKTKNIPLSIINGLHDPGIVELILNSFMYLVPPGILRGDIDRYATDLLNTVDYQLLYITRDTNISIGNRFKLF